MHHQTIRIGSVSILLATLAAWGCGSVSLVAPDQTSVQYSQVDVVVGSGAQAATGSTVTVTYTGWLYSETAADHKGVSFGSGTFPFTIGDGTVISGFDQGIIGMQVGGIRRLTVPPSMAYGAQGNPSVNIPPNAALVFDVTLNGVQ